MNEENESVEGADVVHALEHIKTIAKYLCWLPSKLNEFDEWRSFLVGLAEAEGLDVALETQVATTDAELYRSK